MMLLEWYNRPVPNPTIIHNVDSHFVEYSQTIDCRWVPICVVVVVVVVVVVASVLHPRCCDHYCDVRSGGGCWSSLPKREWVVTNNADDCSFDDYYRSCFQGDCHVVDGVWHRVSYVSIPGSWVVILIRRLPYSYGSWWWWFCSWGGVLHLFLVSIVSWTMNNLLLLVDIIERLVWLAALFVIPSELFILGIWAILEEKTFWDDWAFFCWIFCYGFWKQREKTNFCFSSAFKVFGAHS